MRDLQSPPINGGREVPRGAPCKISEASKWLDVIAPLRLLAKPKLSKHTPVCPPTRTCCKMQGCDNGTMWSPPHSTKMCKFLHLLRLPWLRFIPSSLFPPSRCAGSHPPPPTTTPPKERHPFHLPRLPSCSIPLFVQTSRCTATFATSFLSRVDLNTKTPKGHVLNPRS